MTEYVIYDEELPSDEEGTMKILVNADEKQLMERLVKRLDEMSSSPVFLENEELAIKIDSLAEDIKNLFYSDRQAGEYVVEEQKKISMTLLDLSNELKNVADSVKKSVIEATINRDLYDNVEERIEDLSSRTNRMLELLAAMQEVYKLLGQKNMESNQALSDRFSVFESKIAELADSNSEIKENIKLLQNMENTDITALEPHLDRINESIQDFASIIKEFSSYFENSHELNKNMLSAIRENYDFVVSRIDASNESSMENKNELLSRLDFIENKIKGLGFDDGLQYTQRLDEIAKQLAIIGENNETREMFSDLKARIVGIERRLETLDIDSKIEKSSLFLSQKLLDIEEKISYSVQKETEEYKDIKNGIEEQQKQNERLVAAYSEQQKVLLEALREMEESESLSEKEEDEIISRDTRLFKESMDGMGESIEALKESIDSAKDRSFEELRRLGSRIEEVSKRIDEVKLSSDVSDIDRINEGIDLIRDHNFEETRKLRAEIEEVSKKLGEMKNFEKINEMVDSLKEERSQESKKIRADIEDISKNMTELSKNVLFSKSSMEKMNENIDILKKSVDSAKDLAFEGSQKIDSTIEDASRKIIEIKDAGYEKSASALIELSQKYESMDNNIRRYREDMLVEIEKINTNILEIRNDRDRGESIEDLRESLKRMNEAMERYYAYFGENLKMAFAETNSSVQQIKNEINAMEKKFPDVDSELKRMVFALEVMQAKQKEFMNKIEEAKIKKPHARTKNTKRIVKSSGASASRAQTREALVELADSSILQLLGNTTKMNTNQIINSVPVSKNMAKNRLVALNKTGRIKRQKEGNSIFYSL